MVKLTLMDGNILEVPKGTTGLDAAKAISMGLARNAMAVKIDGELHDLRDTLDKDSKFEVLTFDDEGGRWAFRHTTSHILAQAVERLFPGTKLAIGPATYDGYYYDFDKDEPFNKEEILAIEEEMKKIVKEDLPIERYTLSKEEALDYYNKIGEIYKVEVIEELPEDETITFYKQGDFTDLCAGPHLMSTKPIRALHLNSEGGSSGAYWRGDENNKMLSRIYGTSFPKASLLDDYLEMRKEALKRDHNKLGRELKIFTTDETIGQGLPIIRPKGHKVFQLLQRFVEDEEERRGYVYTKTPYMAKSDLYKISGHWDLYRDGLFIIGDPEKEKESEVFALRPMTCPFQFVDYNSDQHSYRDLPIRYAETSTLFRNEASGEMHGLIRLRQFTISEGHIVCRRDQVGEEFKGVFELTRYLMETLGIYEDITFQLSLWDPNNKDKYHGDAKDWEEIQDYMRNLLNEMDVEYKEEEGEAAFYGPKLDIQFRNVHGKEDTIITIQIDFTLAERFNMTYVDTNGDRVHPLVVHRTSVGCYERTIAMLIEKYAGAFPTWLAPVQAKVIPISDKFEDYAEKVRKELWDNNIRVELDDRSEKLGYKIRQARNERIPYILVVGEKEEEDGTVSVRSRSIGDEGAIKMTDFLPRILEEIRTKDLAAALPTAIKLKRY